MIALYLLKGCDAGGTVRGAIGASQAPGRIRLSRAVFGGAAPVEHQQEDGVQWLK